VAGPERIDDFLRTCGIRSRLVGEAGSSAPAELLETNIDYDAVFETLAPHIDRSRSFLANALKP
jgi:hypothetical protein